MLPVTAVARSFAGGREHNEDLVAIERAPDGSCLVLSDGAGGHADGAIAARTAVEKILDGYRARPPADPADLAELLLDAHEAVLAAQRDRASAQPMHATIVVLALDHRRDSALWGHVGDSRLYVLRGGRIVGVTRDDSVVQSMVDSGYLAPEQARVHPGKNSLLAALGVDSELKPTVCAQPLAIANGDAFLLCSDGWWEAVDNEAIEAALAQSLSVQDWVDAMAEQVAYAVTADRDNYSAIGCWVGHAGTNGLDRRRTDGRNHAGALR